MKTTKEQNLKNRNHGITLIALVITIIVMLILVAVTVTMAVNGGLFGHAQTAARKTNNAMADEQALGNGRIKIGGTWYDSPQDYVDNKPSANQGDGITGGGVTEDNGGTTGGNDESTDNTGDELTLTIKGEEEEVTVGSTITLTLEDSNGTTISDNITWSSSNETAATVANGVVTGLRAAKENEEASVGKTTITATYNGKIAIKEIMVKPLQTLCRSCNGTSEVRYAYCSMCETERICGYWFWCGDESCGWAGTLSEIGETFVCPECGCLDYGMEIGIICSSCVNMVWDDEYDDPKPPQQDCPDCSDGYLYNYDA